MPKIGDAYLQFSTRGLKDVIRELNSVAATGRGINSIGGSSGFFSDALTKDIAKLKVLTDNLKTTKRIVDQLKSVQIESAMAVDRAHAARDAKLKSRTSVASRVDEATAASPSMLAAERKAIQLRAETARKSRDDIRRSIMSDPDTSSAFKSRASAVSGIQAKGGMSPGQLRDSAKEARDLADSLSRFKVGNASQVRDEMRGLAKELEDAANAAERLQQIEIRSSSMTVADKGRIRGSIRDELDSERRVNATSDRQAVREIQSVSPRELMGRRVDELRDRSDLTPGQENQEIALASDEVATTLRNLAQNIRESDIDAALAQKADDLASGKISESDFLAANSRAEIGRKASRSATSASTEKIGENSFFAETGGSARTAEMNQSLTQLNARYADLEKSSRGLVGAEKERADVEKNLLKSDIENTQAKAEASEELDKQTVVVKKLLAQKSKLDLLEIKQGGLTKEQKRERRENNKAIAEAAQKEKLLQRAIGGTNANLKASAKVSRSFNFQLQQASYGVQDFVQVIGQTGLSGALRASANNMASFFGAMGTPQSAIVGALGTIAMIGIAEAIQRIGWESETAEEKLKRFMKRLEGFQEDRNQWLQFSGELLSDRLGQPGFSVESGVSVRQRGSQIASDSSFSSDKLEVVAKLIALENSSIWKKLFQGEKKDLAVDRITLSVKEFTEKYAEEQKIRKFQSDPTGNVAARLKEIRDLLQSGEITRDEAEFQAEIADPYSIVRGAQQRAKDIQRISLLDTSDPEDLGELARIIDPKNEQLADAIDEARNHFSEMNKILRQSAESYRRTDASLTVMEKNVKDFSEFDGKYASEQAKFLADALAASAKRLEIEQSKIFLFLGEDGKIKDSLPKPAENEAKFRQKLIDEEKKVYDRYLRSLNAVNDSLRTSRAGEDLAGSIGNLVGGFVAARRRLEDALSEASPEDRQRALQSSDISQMRKVFSEISDEVLEFDGEVKKRFGESQEEANDRMADSLRDLARSIRDNEIKADDSLVPLIEHAIAKIGKAEQEASAQERTSVTPIEGLHKKIQDSLNGEDADLDLLKEQRDILSQIRDNTAGGAAGKVPKIDLSDIMKSAQEFIIKSAQEFMDSVTGSLGQMSVPPPKFDPSMASPAGPDELEALNADKTISNKKKELKESLNRELDSFSSPSVPTGGSADAANIMSDPDLMKMRKIVDDVGKRRTELFVDKSNREQQSIGLQSESRRGLSKRNISAMSSRGRGFTGQDYEETEAEVRRKIQEQGYSDFLDKSDRSADAFFGARRGGTVSDSPAQRRGVYDGPRSPRLTPSQAAALSPLNAEVPGETPEQNRKRGIAERRARFGPLPDAGPELNAKTIKSAIAALPPVREGAAGPVATREEAEKFRKERIAAAGPVPEATREARKGPRTLAREAARAAKGKAAREERAEKIAEARAEREALKARRLKIKKLAEDDLESRRRFDPETGEKLPTSKNVNRRRDVNSKAGKSPSFMEQIEAGISPDEIIKAKELKSNVNTGNAPQSAKAEGEAIGFQRRSAKALEEMLKIMKERAERRGDDLIN